MSLGNVGCAGWAAADIVVTDRECLCHNVVVSHLHARAWECIGVCDSMKNHSEKRKKEKKKDAETEEKKNQEEKSKQ